MLPPEDDAARFERAARFLADGHRARDAFAPIPAPLTPRSVDEAFCVQGALHALMRDTHGPVAGYKIALTTAVMQQMVGYQEPIPGAIFARTVHASGCTVSCADYTRLGVECELAVRLAHDLAPTGAPFDRERVAAAVGEVMAAFELVDDRNVDYAVFAPNILSFIADNAWNAGVVLGEAVTDWRGLDLAAVPGEAQVNGERAGQGHGRDVMGHPLDALAWLANLLTARGVTLGRGMLVMTGSIIATRFVSPGDRMRFTLGGLPAVQVAISASGDRAR